MKANKLVTSGFWLGYASAVGVTMVHQDLKYGSPEAFCENVAERWTDSSWWPLWAFFVLFFLVCTVLARSYAADKYDRD
jgi:hypothetical protein